MQVHILVIEGNRANLMLLTTSLVTSEPDLCGAAAACGSGSVCLGTHRRLGSLKIGPGAP